MHSWLARDALPAAQAIFSEVTVLFSSRGSAVALAPARAYKRDHKSLMRSCEHVSPVYRAALGMQLASGSTQGAVYSGNGLSTAARGFIKHRVR